MEVTVQPRLPTNLGSNHLSLLTAVSREAWHPSYKDTGFSESLQFVLIVKSICVSQKLLMAFEVSMANDIDFSSENLFHL